MCRKRRRLENHSPVASELSLCTCFVGFSLNKILNDDELWDLKWASLNLQNGNLFVTCLFQISWVFYFRNIYILYRKLVKKKERMWWFIWLRQMLMWWSIIFWVVSFSFYFLDVLHCFSCDTAAYVTCLVR